MTRSTTQTVIVRNHFTKPVLASFEQDNRGSDGGAILIRGIDSRLRLSHSGGFVIVAGLPFRFLLGPVLKASGRHWR